MRRSIAILMLLAAGLAQAGLSDCPMGAAPSEHAGHHSSHDSEPPVQHGADDGCVTALTCAGAMAADATTSHEQVPVVIATAAIAEPADGHTANPPAQDPPPPRLPV